MQRTRPGIRERDARRTEALLLCLVLLTLGVGGALALLAHGRDAASGTSVLLNVNTASAAQLAQRLGVSGEAGKRLVERRATLGGFADVDAIARVPLVADVRETAERLRRAGLSTPSVASQAQIKKALNGAGGDALAARIIAVRDARPAPAQTWERVLAAPVVPPVTYAKAKVSLIARSWDDAQRAFLIACGMLTGFFVVAHLLLRLLLPRADPFLLPITAFLSTLGFLLLFAIKDPLRDMPTFAYQASGIAIGGGIALLVAWARPLGRLPLHRYGYLYALAAALGTLVLGVLGSGPGGVKLSVGGTQPVEVIKILLVFFLAAYLAERGPLLADPLRMVGLFPIPRRRDVLPLALLYALPLALFALVKDLGPVLLLFGAFLLLTYLATGRGVYVLLGVVTLGVGGVAGYALHFGVFQTRVLMWLSPWSNVKTGGDQLALGLWGMASGGPIGSGLGLGGTRFIPRGGSDLALAALGEEAGLVATVAVTLCFLVLALRGLVIARRAATDFDRLLAAGLSGLLGIQALVIIAGTLGLFPLAGVTLPFVSNGKSSLVVSFFIVGFLLTLSAKSDASTGGGVPALPVPRLFAVASARAGLFFALTLGALCIARLVWVQAVRADVLATHSVRTPDADGVRRPHINPRFLVIAERIGRGRLLDRNGKVVAETRNGKRVYPYGGAMAHLVGYVDPAVGGPTGFEETLSLPLRGFDTSASLLPVWRTKDLPGARLPQGKDVALTLDAELQKTALAALQNGAARVRDRRNGRRQNRGAVIVLDIETGGVLAAVTSPTFDPQTLTPARMQSLTADLDNDYPLINRATSGYYPPGSTFKIVTASALLATGKADFTTNCAHIATNVFWKERTVPYGRRRIVDDEGDRPHGLTNLSEAVVDSCNVYFGKAGILLGSDALRDHAARYGFAHLPSLLDFDITLPDAAYGQGRVLASPLEMAGVALTIASGGKRYAPQFVLSARPKLADTPLSPADAARLADMMRRVTVSGTAAGRFSDLPFTVAGKTGTAQNDQRDRAPHSWFIGFAPANGPPKVAFAVIVENGGYGAQTAAPIAREVLHAALH